MFLSGILPYTIDAFHSFYGDEFIAIFTHATLATGQIDRTQAKKLVEQLNAGASRIMPCISFNEEMLTGNQLEGGACSSIAFRVAKEALVLQSDLKEIRELKPSSREQSFALRFSDYVHNLEDMAKGKNAPSKALQSLVRTEQAAFNTITVNRDTIHPGNAVSEKVGAMAPFYGLKVVESSPELRVKGNEQLEKQLLEQMRSLKEGVYFLRIIQEKYNHKLEEKGHSAVFIKTESAEYSFDPAVGSYTLFSEASKTNLIYNTLLSANERFGVDVLSFHKLEEENRISSDLFDVPDLKLKGVIYSPDPVRNVPAIIFSPGLGVSIAAYKTMTKGLCSRGFVVMSVEHPGTGLGAPRLDEPAIIACGLQNGSNIEKLVKLIREGVFAKISANAPLAVLGHSLGGSASIEACRLTPEIKTAINMDGRIIKPKGVLQPVLQIVAKQVKEDRTQYNAALEELAKINSSFTRLEVEAKHGDFSYPHPDFLSKTIEQCVLFLNQHLVQG